MATTSNAKTSSMSPRECALLAAQVADDKKATDIMVQEVGKLTSTTEFFVIATAANNRQVDAIVDAIGKEEREKAGITPLSREGLEAGTWALIDYGSFVVHVFQPEARDYYRLESLWNDAPIVDLKAEGITDVVYSDRIAKLFDQISSHQQTTK